MIQLIKTPLIAPEVMDVLDKNRYFPLVLVSTLVGLVASFMGFITHVAIVREEFVCIADLIGWGILSIIYYRAVRQVKEQQKHTIA